MADCTKTAEFIREWNRMCREHDRCGECPFWGVVCTEEAAVTEVPEDVIAIVQKWSDEHPVMTWKGKLLELLPNHGLAGLCVCPKAFFGDHAPGLDTCRNDTTCVECWQGEYKEAP